MPGVSEKNAVVDRLPPPGLEPFGRAEYVDNFPAFGMDRGVVKSVAEEVQQKLRVVDLPTHPVEAGPGATTLGWAFSEENAAVGLSHRFSWKIRLAMQQILLGARDWGHPNHIHVALYHLCFLKP